MNTNTRLLALLMGILLLLNQQRIQAQLNNHHKNYIEIGFVGGGQLPHSGLGGVYGAVGTFFKAFNRPSSLDVRVKESYVTNPDQQSTLITLTYRISLVKGLFFGIGGSHSHQIRMNDFLTHPGGAIGGTDPHITHSSGYNLELGYNFNSFIRDRYVGIYPNLHIGYAQTFTTGQSFQNLTFNAGFRVGMKKWE